MIHDTFRIFSDPFNQSAFVKSGIGDQPDFLSLFTNKTVVGLRVLNLSESGLLIRLYITDREITKTEVSFSNHLVFREFLDKLLKQTNCIRIIG